MHSKRIREKVKEDYNTIAKEFSQTRRFSWQEFDEFLKYYTGGAVLDLGCGNGRLLGFLEENGYQTYLGVDQSSELLKEARKKHGVNNFKEADISELSEIGEFDSVFAIASFHHIPPKDQLKTLKLWKRHMKPGAKLYMTNWNLFQTRFIKNWLYFPRPSLFGLLIPWKHRVYRYYYAFTMKRLARLLKKAGYTLIEQKSSKKNIITIAEA